jgi:hypothetical protein
MNLTVTHLMVTTGVELRELVGWEVSSVCFVRDYVELHFDGPILRSLAAPIVCDADGRFQYPTAGSRDALCRLIGQVVERADDDRERVLLRFADGAEIHIPKAAPGMGPEIAHFVPATGVARMTVWENSLPTRDEP